LPARPIGGGEFSDRLRTIADRLDAGGESKWASAINDVVERIGRFGYGDGPVAENNQAAARQALEQLAVSNAAERLGLRDDVEYALGFIRSYLQRPGRPRTGGKHHMHRRDRFAPPSIE
jgi:hypothetical protein